MTFKYEVTIVEKNGPASYNTYTRGVMTIGSVLNQFVRYKPELLRNKLMILSIGETLEWERKPGVSVMFRRLDPRHKVKMPKHLSIIIIANNGEDGKLTLIVSDDTGEDHGQNGIEFDIPNIGKDVAIQVGNEFELNIRSID